jgi:hypothetical protein
MQSGDFQRSWQTTLINHTKLMLLKIPKNSAHNLHRKNALSRALLPPKFIMSAWDSQALTPLLF